MCQSGSLNDYAKKDFQYLFHRLAIHLTPWKSLDLPELIPSSWILRTTLKFAVLFMSPSGTG